MSDLICENYPMLLVMSRFGIALGFGEQTIGEVCRNHRVDIQTFLMVVNVLINEDSPEEINTSLSLECLLSYLKNSHVYFLEFRLPAIRSKLIEAIGGGQSDVARAIVRYYDEYVAEVRKHMQYEEDTVFPYVDSLRNGRERGKKHPYHIGIFYKQHNHIESRLSELKDIIIKYYPASSSNELNSVLFDIFTCAQDLASHNYVEDCLFVPVILELERKEGV